jgi:hypothetical protein
MLATSMLAWTWTVATDLTLDDIEVWHRRERLIDGRYICVVCRVIWPCLTMHKQAVSESLGRDNQQTNGDANGPKDAA